MLVKDVMSRGAKTVTPDTDMQKVASLMCLHRFSGLPVVEDDDTLVGFIAERDVLRHMFPSLQELMENMSVVDFEGLEQDYQKVFQLKVADLMHTGVITVSPDIPILKAVSIMARHNFRRIPVADGNKLLGVISLGDIHRAIFMESFTK